MAARARIETSKSGYCTYVVVGDQLRLLDDGVSGMPELRGQHEFSELNGKTKKGVNGWISRNVKDYIPDWETSHGNFQ